MKHLGDIKSIDGKKIEPVDIITFGSPCQDLSIAGKGKGLKGERSGLFIEAIRIIREMRNATGGLYPKFAVWENVPGAFSSPQQNPGADFRSVLEELAEAEISMPRSGKWAKSGLVRVSSGYVYWRTLDAQYWGVPQGRKRIFVVRDFRNDARPEILFGDERMREHFIKSGKARKNAATTIERCDSKYNYEPVNITQITSKINRSRVEFGMPVGTLCSNNRFCVVSIQGNSINRSDSAGCSGAGARENISYTLNTVDRHAVAYEKNGKYEIRYLTPLEWERLQGFPDNWTEGHSDPQRYKALGNSVPIPFVMYVLSGIVNDMRKEGSYNAEITR